MQFAAIGTEALCTLCASALLAVLLPVGLAVLFGCRKKERFTTFLTGAAVFLLFVLVPEKPLQSFLLSPVHAVGRFFCARPALYAVMIALFPGVFEETGRFIAFKSVLRRRKNRETAIAFGIGHGGCEAVAVPGITYVTYAVYAFMINAGTFGNIAAQAPEQTAALYSLAYQLSVLRPADLLPAFIELGFSMLFHIGASILVFYACRGRLLLYPLAIAAHAVSDPAVALALVGCIPNDIFLIEAVTGAFSVVTFALSYILLYRKDKPAPPESA